VFYFSYMFAELRRRRGRTLLTALGLAVGVGLVVSVNALSTGLDQAQRKVLEPLTGVGTDMAVTRPIKLSANGGSVFGQLSQQQRNKLRKQGGQGAGFGFAGAKPGSKIDTDTANSPQVSFSSNRARTLASLADVTGAAGYLTLNVNHVTGTVPKVRINRSQGGSGQGGGVPGGGTFGGFGNSSIKFSSRTVTGIDLTKPDLAPVTASQIVKGHYFGSTGGAYEAIVSQSYANTNSINVGDKILLFAKKFTVVGISSAPLGGTASNIYVDLGTLQKLAGYKGEINGVNVRAAKSSDVTSVATTIKTSFKGASVTTAADLAKRVGGSLSDAKNLSSKLGTALEGVGLLAAVLIACLLTLSSVAKRVREIGTLKAIGWSRWTVVRQISGESLLQGLIGGVIGAAVGVAGAAAINAVGWTLKASVAGASSATGRRAPGGFGFGGAASSPTSGSELVKITTSVDFRLLLAAIALAVAGGLVAGAVGGLRAARLRPAAALRTVE
jgi:ABC-type antimicrobial peptide transport system permease subunit